MAERWVSCSLILLILSMSMVVDGGVPAVFILGDSTADVGTNNHFNNTIAKADHPHNGIDFPGSIPTGRFSNGFNSADYLSKLMGFKRSPPPFLTLMKAKQRLNKLVLRGVNFASGGSGLLNETGKPLGKVVPLGEQIQQFATVNQILTKTMGQNATKSFLSKSLFFVSVGSNDIFQNFAFNRNTDKQLFIATLTNKYEQHLRMLYSLGAKKIGIISVPPIGCCPSQRIHNTSTGGGCLEDLNEYSRMFYSSIEALLNQLSSEFNGLKYSLGNAYEMVTNFMDNPLPFNFTELKTACCGNGTFNGEAPCSPKAKLCSNRDQYLFWDMYHPTQAAAELAALTLYGAAPRFVTPINFKQLAELDN